jgi:hypothetical protein
LYLFSLFILGTLDEFGIFGEVSYNEAEGDSEMEMEDIPDEAKNMPKIDAQMQPPSNVHIPDRDNIKDYAAQAGIKLGSVYDQSESDI